MIGQHFGVHQACDGVLHQALLLGERAAHVEQVQGIDCGTGGPGGGAVGGSGHGGLLRVLKTKPREGGAHDTGYRPGGHPRRPWWHRHGRSCTLSPMKIPEILLIETVHQPGSLARVLQVIADAGLAIEHLTALRRDQGRTLWEITLEMDEEADRSLFERIGALPSARFVGKSDRVFNRHRGGKIRTAASLPDQHPPDTA